MTKFKRKTLDCYTWGKARLKSEIQHQQLKCSIVWATVNYQNDHCLFLFFKSAVSIGIAGYILRTVVFMLTNITMNINYVTY